MTYGKGVLVIISTESSGVAAWSRHHDLSRKLNMTRWTISEFIGLLNGFHDNAKTGLNACLGGFNNISSLNIN